MKPLRTVRPPQRHPQKPSPTPPIRQGFSQGQDPESRQFQFEPWRYRYTSERSDRRNGQRKEDCNEPEPDASKDIEPEPDASNEPRNERNSNHRASDDPQSERNSSPPSTNKAYDTSIPPPQRQWGSVKISAVGKIKPRVKSLLKDTKEAFFPTTDRATDKWRYRRQGSTTILSIDWRRRATPGTKKSVL